MDQLSKASQNRLRTEFRPRAKINAYLMYTSALSVPLDSDKAVERGPQPFTEGELNGIRKAPTVEKLLKLVGPGRGAKEVRDRTVRKPPVNFLKVPLLDGTPHSDTESDEERQRQATLVMQSLHLRFCSTSSAPDTQETKQNIALTPGESIEVTPKKTEGKAEALSTRAINHTKETCGDSSAATRRVRPMSANDSRHVHPPGRLQLSKHFIGPPQSPFAIRLKGQKVRDRVECGAMFRPFSSRQTSPHAFGHILSLRPSAPSMDGRYYP